MRSLIKTVVSGQAGFDRILVVDVSRWGCFQNPDEAAHLEFICREAGTPIENVAAFAQDQIDWTLGRNPYDMSLLYGFGAKNPPHADSAGDMVVGGISNGITGGVGSEEGRGIAWAEGPDEQNWRWIEQWLPHTSWFLLLASLSAPEAQ